MSYDKEFPGFVLGVQVPGFVRDASSRHDVCPKFECEVGDKIVRLWVDWEDPDDREMGGKRFCVQATSDVLSLETVCETDDWGEALRALYEVTGRKSPVDESPSVEEIDVTEAYLPTSDNLAEVGGRLMEVGVSALAEAVATFMMADRIDGVIGQDDVDLQSYVTSCLEDVVRDVVEKIQGTRS